MSQTNGAVILGREMRLTISPQHSTSLQALAKVHGWASPTALAESLLADAIERSARNTAMSHVFNVLTSMWLCGRIV